MPKMIQQILELLTPEERKNVYTLIGAVVFVTLLDVVGVVSIFPFLKVVSDPAVIHSNTKLKWFYDFGQFSSSSHFIIALGIITFLVIVISNVFRAWILTWLMRVTKTIHYNISSRLLTKYLYESYAFFLNRNSAELTTYLMAEVGRVVGYILTPMIHLLAKFSFIVLIFVTLVFINPIVAFCVFGVVGMGYGLIYFLTRKRISQVGVDIKSQSLAMYKVLNEAFGGIKETKLLGKEGVFINRFFEPANKVVDGYCIQFMVTTVPKYVFESLAFGSIIIITMYSVVVHDNYQDIIPIVGLYAVAAYRMLPSVQQIFQSISSIRFGLPALEPIYEDMKGGIVGCHVVEEVMRMPFEKKFTFNKVLYQYPEAEKPVIEEFDLEIKCNTTIGFVGGTGAGKTTIIDILLGLLSPSKGEVFVDGVVLDDENRKSWQKNIGYVPQHIYLLDDTVTRNIAFGVLDEDIDYEAVEKAAKLANIHDFIISKLSQGYETEVGERGVRFSGGERQRIGIARALYHNPSLLVFDEATSALDGITEKAIIDAIYGLTHQKTIAIIAHRLASVKQCDVIYFLEKGKIIAQGSYDELLRTNEKFRKMASDV